MGPHNKSWLFDPLPSTIFSVKPETMFRRNKVVPYLKKLNQTFSTSIQQQSIRGSADLVLCVHGWFVWLELKDDGEEPSPLQAYNASCVRAVGGIAIVAKPNNWKAVTAFLTLLNAGVYDKNLLRRVEQHTIPISDSKTIKRTAKNSGSNADQARSESLAESPRRDGGELQEGCAGSVRSGGSGSSTRKRDRKKR